MGAWTRYGCPACGTTLTWPTGPGWGIACVPCGRFYAQALLDSLPLSSFHSWRLLHLASGQLLDVACRSCSSIAWEVVDYLLKDGWLPWGVGHLPQTWTCPECNVKTSLGKAAATACDEPPPPPDPDVMEAVIEALSEPEPGITKS